MVSKSVKALIVAGPSVLAVLAASATAWATPGGGQGERGCAAQLERTGELRSPVCLPEGGFRPPVGGLESNHSETLVRDST